MNIVPVRNRLVYPAGVAPGFDPTHPAARGVVRFSGVCTSPGTFTNILNGKVGTIVGAQSGKMIGLGGPVACSGQSNSVRFSGNPTVADTTYTIAAVINPAATASNDFFIFRSGVSPFPIAMIAQGTGTDTGLSVRIEGVGNSIPTPFPLFGDKGPVFVVLSRQPGGANPLTVSCFKILKSGVGYLSNPWTDYGYAAPASGGTYEIGGYPSTGSDPSMGVAAVMFSTASLSPQEMAAWAEDPWSFWYPRGVEWSSLTSRLPYRPTFQRSNRQVVIGDPSGAKVIQS